MKYRSSFDVSFQLHEVQLSDSRKEIVSLSAELSELKTLKSQLEERIRTLDHDGQEQVKQILSQLQESKEQQHGLRTDKEKFEAELKDALDKLQAGEMELKRVEEEKEEIISREKEICREKEEIISREKERYKKLETSLWAKEREVQDLKEAQQKRMLDGEVSVTILRSFKN